MKTQKVRHTCQDTHMQCMHGSENLSSQNNFQLKSNLHQMNISIVPVNSSNVDTLEGKYVNW